jgi:hypothetical protein
MQTDSNRCFRKVASSALAGNCEDYSRRDLKKYVLIMEEEWRNDE